MRKLILALGLLVSVIVGANNVEAQTYDNYTVQKGDSLWKIAVKYHIGVSEIISANPQIENPNLIYPKQKVKVPNIDHIKTVEMAVVDLTNQARAKNGLSPLEVDWELSRVARYKSADMKSLNYFSHSSPSYGSPFDMMKNFGIKFLTAGENIAKGQPSAKAVVDAWLNSEGHRKNIMSSEFTHIGIGYVKEGHIWTQMFIKK